MNASAKCLFFVFLYCSIANAEWIEYSNPTNKLSTVTFSTSSLKRQDEMHYSVNIFTNYSLVQTSEINRRRVQFQSKSETQFFGCESQEFALGDYELYQNRDANGSRTVVTQRELIWNSIAPNTLQMDLLKKFCTIR